MTTNEITVAKDILVMCHNIKLNQNESTALSRVLKKLKSLCPHHSVLRANLQQQNTELSLDLDVTSFQGPFQTSTKASDLTQLLALAQEELVEKLNRWKNARFDKQQTPGPVAQER